MEGSRLGIKFVRIRSGERLDSDSNVYIELAFVYRVDLGRRNTVRRDAAGVGADLTEHIYHSFLGGSFGSMQSQVVVVHHHQLGSSEILPIPMTIPPPPARAPPPPLSVLTMLIWRTTPGQPNCGGTWGLCGGTGCEKSNGRRGID